MNFLEDVPWQKILNIISPLGLIGLFVSIWTFIWNRNQNRLQALSEIVEPWLGALQGLNDAYLARKTCLEIRRAYRDPASTPEAVQTFNRNVDSYAKAIDTCVGNSKAMERQLGAKAFRLPDKFSKRLRSGLDLMGQGIQYLNAGRLDEVELTITGQKSIYSEIKAMGRGWRLNDPFEWLRASVWARWSLEREKEEETQLEQEWKEASELVHKRMTSQLDNSFAVHPPKKLLEKPTILQSDSIVEELQDSIFEVVFQDGTYKMLTLSGLVMLTQQIILAAHHMKQVETLHANADFKDVEFHVKFSIHPKEFMRPEVVKLILSKVEFSNEPSD